MRLQEWGRKRGWLTLVLMALAWLVGCIQPAPTYVPTLTPSLVPSGTPTPTAVPPTPTATPVPPTPTATSTATATPTPTLTPTPSPPSFSRLLVVSLGGLRPDALSLAPTPNLDGLIARGAICWGAQTVLPSYSLPAHASMLGGVGPEVHGLTWKEYEPERDDLDLFTVFNLAHDAGLTTAMVVGRERFRHLASPESVDIFDYSAGGDRAVIGRAVAHLAQEEIDLMLVYLPDVALMGYVHGWLSSRQLEQVALTDAAIGELLAALDESALVIVTADHGGLDTTHGGAEPESMTIPWLIAGPGVVPGRDLEGPVVIYDTAATIAWALRLEPPADWQGRWVGEAFVP